MNNTLRATKYGGSVASYYGKKNSCPNSLQVEKSGTRST
jgi:hypothetical protein